MIQINPTWSLSDNPKIIAFDLSFVSSHKNLDDDDDGSPAYSHQSKSHHSGVLTVMIMVGICHQRIPTIEYNDDDENDNEKHKPMHFNVLCSTHVAHAFQNPQLYNPQLYNQSCYFRPELYDWERNIKYIPESQEYKFISNTKSFKH